MISYKGGPECAREKKTEDTESNTKADDWGVEGDMIKRHFRKQRLNCFVRIGKDISIKIEILS